MTDRQLKAVARHGDILLHSPWVSSLDSMPAEAAGKILKAITAFVLRGEKPEDPFLAMISALIFPDIEADCARIAATAPKPRAPRHKPSTETKAAPQPEPATELPEPEILPPPDGDSPSGTDNPPHRDIKKSSRKNKNDSRLPASKPPSPKARLETYGLRARNGDARIRLTARDVRCRRHKRSALRDGRWRYGGASSPRISH